MTKTTEEVIGSWRAITAPEELDRVSASVARFLEDPARRERVHAVLRGSIGPVEPTVKAIMAALTDPAEWGRIAERLAGLVNAPANQQRVQDLQQAVKDSISETVKGATDALALRFDALMKDPANKKRVQGLRKAVKQSVAQTVKGVTDALTQKLEDVLNDPASQQKVQGLQKTVKDAVAQTVKAIGEAVTAEPEVPVKDNATRRLLAELGASRPAAIVAVPVNRPDAAPDTVVADPEVEVRDVGGDPIPGVAVTFVVVEGNGGTIGGRSAMVVRTNRQGRATASPWRLGDVGAQRVEATVARLIPAIFKANAA